MKRLIFITMVMIGSLFVNSQVYAGASQFGIGFKRGIDIGEQLIITKIRPISSMPLTLEVGGSYWTDSREESNLHLEFLGNYSFIELEKALVGFYGGVQYTKYGGDISDETYGTLGIEVEYFLVDRISLLANGSFDIDIQDFPASMGNSSDSFGTGFMIYF